MVLTCTFDLLYLVSPASDSLSECLRCLIYVPLTSDFHCCLSPCSIADILRLTTVAPFLLFPQPGEPTVTGATTTRAGGSAGSTRGTATEREATTEESWARATTMPASEPKKINTHLPILLSSKLQFACVLPIPIYSNTTSQLQPKNAQPKHPILALHVPSPGSQSQPAS